MKVKNFKDVQEEKVKEGAQNTTIRWLLTEKEGAEHFYMRLFEIGPHGSTPHHSHAWEHEFFILEGEGKLMGDGISYPLQKGDAGFVPPGEIHHFESTPDTTMKMLCLIPSKNCSSG